MDLHAIHRRLPMAAVFKGPGIIDIEERKAQCPGSGQLLVKVTACGVCGTDVHIFKGEAPARSSVVLGHEYYGQVVEVGDSVECFRIGDLVAVDPNISCGFCYHCRIGKPHLCRSMEALGVTLDGGFATYSIVPANQCYSMPDGVAPGIGVFVEPVACCVHGVDMAGIRAGSSVVIFGAGPIGLILLQLARNSGATTRIVAEISRPRRELARSLGATHVFNPAARDVRNVIAEVVPDGADVVIDAAGTAETLTASLDVCTRGGSILLFAVAPEALKVPVSPFEIYRKELRVQGSYVNPNTFSRAIGILASGAVDVLPLVGLGVTLSELPAVLSQDLQDSRGKTVVWPE